MVSLTLSEEHRISVFETRVLRKMFGRKRQILTECWRKLYNEDHYDLQFSSDIIPVIKSRRGERSWACDLYGEEEQCIQGFMGRSERK